MLYSNTHMLEQEVEIPLQWKRSREEMVWLNLNLFFPTCPNR